MSGVVIEYLAPSITSRNALRLRTSASRLGRGMRTPAMSDAERMNDIALIANTGTTPSLETRTPPRAGPTMIAKLNVVPTMALAATTSPSPTTFGTHARRLGWNNAPQTPRRAATK